MIAGSMTIPDGIILIDKPAGISSHSVVSKLRRVLGVRRIGHGGTLDPGATGLLVIFVGRATRLADYLGSGLKRYDATIRFGIATDTDDADGKVVATGPLPLVTVEEMSRSRERFLGEIEQVPPAYSAVQVKGRRAYKAARKGEALDLRPRTVRIEAIDIVRWEPPDLDVRVACRSGTYIRSLARDWGRSLGSEAHLVRLRRERSEPFDVQRALTLEEVERWTKAGDLSTVVKSPLPALVETLGRLVQIGSDEAERFIHGASVRVIGCVPGPSGGGPAVVTSAGSLIGLADGRSEKDGSAILLQPRLVWAPGLEPT